ncbi:MAG: protein-L-isoaspartate(D-aspartate) O-methyltransferase [Pirellulales bacterium]
MDTPGKFLVAKHKMLTHQLERRGVTSASVLAAMEHVPRERFLPADQQNDAYSDNALPIDCGQTISQPYIVGLMTEALELSGEETVLEIGTGSGYQTAVLAELARRVISVERHAALSARAGEVLTELGYRNIDLKMGDGTQGWPAEAPYDRILVAAAAAKCPAPLFDQLREGGILVIPLGRADGQMLQAIRKIAGEAKTRNLSPCRFVPLVGAQ